MKTIETKVYTYNELKDGAKETALDWFINSEMEIMTEDSPYYPASVKAEKMLTPWFTGSYMYEMYKEDMESDMLANEYTFTEDGKRFG